MHYVMGSDHDNNINNETKLQIIGYIHEFQNDITVSDLFLKKMSYQTNIDMLLY